MTDSNENKPFNRRVVVPMVGAAAAAFFIGTAALSAGGYDVEADFAGLASGNSKVSSPAGRQVKGPADKLLAGQGKEKAKDQAGAQDLDQAGAQDLNQAGAQDLNQAGAQDLGQETSRDVAQAGAQSQAGAEAQDLDFALEQDQNQAGAQDLDQAISPEDVTSLMSLTSVTELTAEQCRQLLAYSEAVSAMKEAEDVDAFRKVRESFLSLGDFLDAAALAEECGRRVDYADAQKLMEEDYLEALYTARSLLENLGDYEDAPALTLTCAEKIKYMEAISLMEDATSLEELNLAAENLKELGDYKDAAEKAAECTAMLEKMDIYESAVWDMENQQYEKAVKAFEKLQDFADSKEKARICKLMIDYKAALELFNTKKYKEAKEALDSLVKTYPDAEEIVSSLGEMKPSRILKLSANETLLADAEQLLNTGDREGAAKKLKDVEWSALSEESREKVMNLSQRLGEATIYDKALDLYNEGAYYEAYKAFLECGDISDAVEMAEKCIQPFPKTGVLYSNEAFTDRSCQLTIDNTGFMNAYYKLYIGDDLVMTVFIEENEKALFKLPAGTYKMKKAYGNLWFGEQDLFGDEGFYWTCRFGPDSDTAILSPGYGYAIVSGDDGTGIGTHPSPRTTF